jgi:hypothetical protein
MGVAAGDPGRNLMRNAEAMQSLVRRLAARVSAMLDAPVAATYVEPTPDDIAAEAARQEAAAREAWRAALREVRVDLIAVLRSLEDLDEDADALDDAAADGVTRARSLALAERVDDLARQIAELAGQLIEGMG